MNEKRDLEGLSALVTGATSGIGRAAAQELAARGAEVVVHGRDAARGAAVVDRITAEHGKARFVAADLSDPAQLDELAQLAEQAGTADILVNNAGISWFGPTPELDVMTFDRLFTANVRAPYFLVGALAPKMAARGRGSIVNIGSMAGHVGMPGGAAYGATKAALAAMTRSWAAEFSPAGVRVNTIAAGRCTPRSRHPRRPKPSAPPPSWPGPPSPPRSPAWSSSSPHPRPATSPAPSSPPTAAAPPSDPERGPTALNALYAAQSGFSPLATTVVFGVYALAVLASLLTCGKLYDHVGRRRAARPGLAAWSAGQLRTRRRHGSGRACLGPAVQYLPAPAHLIYLVLLGVFAAQVAGASCWPLWP